MSCFIVDEKTPFTTKATIKTEVSKETPKLRTVPSKRSGVTRIGNNTYYYTGKLHTDVPVRQSAMI